jgi:glutamyl-tRNA(Gln) amidotransferase subunit E
MDFESVLSSLKFRKTGTDEILNKLPYLSEKFVPKNKKNSTEHKLNWMMGQLRKQATGNIDLTYLANQIKQMKS